MTAGPVVRARIDPELKSAATAVLSEMGLSVSDAIRLLLVRVVAERALPFDVRVPNQVTEEAMEEVRKGNLERFDDLAEFMADLEAQEDA